MKTNASSRATSGIRITALCLLIAGIAATELRVSEWLAARLAQPSAAQMEIVPPPAIHLGELIAAAH